MSPSRRPLQLRECHLYKISSKEKLASKLSMPSLILNLSDLQELSKDSGNYKIYPCKKTSKPRIIEEPRRKLQVVHKRIHKLLSRIELPTYLHSSVKGKSYLTNSRVHKRNKPLFKIDIKKFFPSVKWVHIYNFFRDSLKCREDVCGLLSDILTFDKHLPTGSCASSIVAYLSFKPMFDEIYEFSIKNKLTMTCYVDDMAFSGGHISKIMKFEIRNIIVKHGLRAHKLKVFSGKQPKIITGVCNTINGERVPNKLQLKINLNFKFLEKDMPLLDKIKLQRKLLGQLDAAGLIDSPYAARAKTMRSNIKKLKYN